MLEPASTEPQDSGANRAQQVLGIVVVVGAAALLVFGIAEAFPHHVRNSANPNFVDNIVANSVVIFAIRLAVLFAVVYVGVSVVGLIGGRRWLTQLGPFKASEPIAQLDSNANLLQDELQDAVGTIEDLSQRLAESDQSLEKSQSDIEFLLDQIDTMEAEKEGK